MTNAARAGQWKQIPTLLARPPAAEAAAHAAAQGYATRNNAQLEVFSAQGRQITAGVGTLDHFTGTLVKEGAVRGEASAVAQVSPRCSLTTVPGPSGWAPPTPNPNPHSVYLQCPGQAAIPLAGGSLAALQAADLFTVRLVQ